MKTMIIEWPGGRCFSHRIWNLDGARWSCDSDWRIDPAGFIFAKCEHFLILTNEKVRW
jgi:hypothetical protein